jgi:hypothetical protein
MEDRIKKFDQESGKEYALKGLVNPYPNGIPERFRGAENLCNFAFEKAKEVFLTDGFHIPMAIIVCDDKIITADCSCFFTPETEKFAGALMPKVLKGVAHKEGAKGMVVITEAFTCDIKTESAEEQKKVLALIRDHGSKMIPKEFKRESIVVTAMWKGETTKGRMATVLRDETGKVKAVAERDCEDNNINGGSFDGILEE